MEFFKFECKKSIPEVSCEAELYTHIKTGARVLKLVSKDDNKVFSIGFRTPPEDNTGYLHIIEHSTLCGSRKYRTKEPFLDLIKGSLNTFLNAFTYGSHTLYPIASRNQRDFDILSDVYLDAVFHPRVVDDLKNAFLQEGWHYHVSDNNKSKGTHDCDNDDEKDDKNNEECEIEEDDDDNKNETIGANGVEYKGVVYNEMRGDYSNPDNALMSMIQQNLFPDNAYRFDSGGDPSQIPNLTYEQFCVYYKRYYHPSNSYTVFYGNGDTASELAHLNEYFSEYDRIDCHFSEITPQKPFSAPQTASGSYPVAADEGSDDESNKNKTFYSVSWQIGDVVSEDGAALIDVGFPVLDSMLVKREGAALKEAILKSGIAHSVTSVFDCDQFQPVYTIKASQAQAGRLKDFVEIVEGTLRRVAEEGFAEDVVESALSRYEFQLREGDFGHYPKGLIYAMEAMQAWLWGGEPTTHIAYEESLAKVKAGGTEYFRELLKSCLLGNNHRVDVALEPDSELDAKTADAARKRLAEAVEKLGEEGIAKCREETAALLKWQNSEDTDEVKATIPHLTLNDIKKEATQHIAEVGTVTGESGVAVPMLTYETATNGVVYADAFFDIQKAGLSLDEVYALGVLCNIFSRMPTKRHTYETLATHLAMNTGTVSLMPQVMTKVSCPATNFAAIALLHVSLLPAKISMFPEIVAELLYEVNFSDHQRLHELLKVISANRESKLRSRPDSAIAFQLRGLTAPSADFTSHVVGLDFTFFVTSLLKSWEEDAAKTASELEALLRSVVAKLFRAENMTLSVTAEHTGVLAAQDVFTKCVDLAAGKPEPAAGGESFFDQQKRTRAESGEGRKPVRRAYVMPTTVNYVGIAQNRITLGHGSEFSGALGVTEHIIGLNHLWNEVRVRGGAYGAFVRATMNGSVSMVSFRDPNLKETIAVYKKTADFLSGLELSQTELELAVIGYIGGYDACLTPNEAGMTAFSNYFSGFDAKLEQKFWDEILACTVDQVRAFAPVFRDVVEKGDIICVCSQDTAEANKDLFDEVKPLLK